MEIAFRRFRKPSLVFVACLFSMTAFADSYNNFTGYSDFWNPLGNPDTSTYGETFTAPSDGSNVLQSFSFYMGNPGNAGDILLNAYIATWTGTGAGTLLYTSSPLDYANVGDAELTFTTGGLTLTPGASYVMFLSVSQQYGLSAGETAISQGAATIPGGSFVYFNNEANFGELFTNTWDATGLSPDWAIDAEFSEGAAVPEPGTIALFGSGMLALAGIARWRRAKK